MTGTFVNVNIRMITNITSVVPFGFLHHHHHHPHQGNGQQGTKPQVATNVYTGVNVNSYGYRTPGSGNGSSTTAAGTTPAIVFGGMGMSPSGGNSSGGSSPAGGYVSSGSTNPGTSDVAAEDPTNPDTLTTGSEPPTTDVSAQAADGLFNFRGGLPSVKLNAVTDAAPKADVVALQPPVARARPNFAEEAPAAQETVSAPVPQDVPGLPVLPSVVGLLTCGTTLYLGWRRFR
jgi:hypothetical protein